VGAESVGNHGQQQNLHGKGELILITEDEQGVRDSIAKILSLYDYRIIKAASPGEAIALVRAHASDISLALMDIVLPGMIPRRLFS
jgi:two-component system, cell cycle sensor histidine kinase and response regulator CckA